MALLHALLRHPASGLALALAVCALSAAAGAGCASDEVPPPEASGGSGPGIDPVGGGGTASDTGTGAGTGGQGGGPSKVDNAELCAAEAPPRVLELSADDSNSMASPAVARELLSLGIAPEPSRIRPHEFLNYYAVPFAAPEAGALLGLEAWMAPEGEGQRSYRLLLGVRAGDTPRPPMNLVLSIDVSGSMKGTGLARAGAAVRAIAGRLREGDVVSLVTWSDEQRDLLVGHAVTGPDDPALLGAISELRARGDSNLATGLARAYELAGAGDAELRRVVLVSDGGANVAAERLADVREQAEEADASEIYLTGIGVGPALGYDDEMMDLLTDAGRGAYVFLDSEDEAARVLGDRFDEVMRVAARDVSVTLTLPDHVRVARFSGEEKGEPGAVRRQHIAPGDAMTFLLSLDMRGCYDSAQRLKVDIGHADQAAGPTLDVSFGELVAASEVAGASTSRAALKAHAILAYAEALASQGGEEPGDPAAIEAALAEIDAARVALDDPELDEIHDLLALHPSAP